jgi:hypothetical protein
MKKQTELKRNWENVSITIPTASGNLHLSGKRDSLVTVLRDIYLRSDKLEETVGYQIAAIQAVLKGKGKGLVETLELDCSCVMESVTGASSSKPQTYLVNELRDYMLTKELIEEAKERYNL